MTQLAKIEVCIRKRTEEKKKEGERDVKRLYKRKMGKIEREKLKGFTYI